MQPNRALYGVLRQSILIEVILHLKIGKIFAEGNGQTNVHACDMLSFDDYYHIGRELLSIIRQSFSSRLLRWNNGETCAFFFSICSTGVETDNVLVMIDLKILGERLRMLRKRMKLTQSELADALNVSQTAISRLENGDEVYASVLLGVLVYFQDTYSLDYLVIEDFDADSTRLKHRSLDDIRQQLERLVNLL